MKDLATLLESAHQDMIGTMEQILNQKLEQVMLFKVFHPRKLVHNTMKNKSYIFVLIVSVSAFALNVWFMVNIKIMMWRRSENHNQLLRLKWTNILSSLITMLKHFWLRKVKYKNKFEVWLNRIICQKSKYSKPLMIYELK